MRRILFIFLLVSNDLIGQPLDGVYAGELVSSKNAFVVSTVGNLAVGSIFLNEKEKLVFLGTFEDSILEGKINLLNGDLLILIGKLSRDSLLINLRLPLDTALVAHNCHLVKISSNTKYNLKKVFGRDRSNRDELLLGKWILVEVFDQNGAKVPFENYTMEFKADGWLYVSSVTLNSQILSSGVRNLEPKTRWETVGSQIVSRFESAMFGSVEHTLNYSISGDTLTTINGKGYKYIYNRK
jgi:hypothetical protein